MKYLNIFLLFLFSCIQQEIREVNSNDKNASIENPEFEEFLDVFPQIKPPVYIEGCNIDTENLNIMMKNILNLIFILCVFVMLCVNLLFEIF